MSNSITKTSLIVAPNWIGDMIMAQALLILLKQADPKQAVDVLAPAWTYALLPYMPEVRDGILSPFQHGELKWRQRLALAKQLRDKQYDQAIILPQSFKSALIPFFSHIPVRIGYKREGRGWLLLTDARSRTDKHAPTVRRLAQLGLSEHQPLPKTLPYPRLHLQAEQLKDTQAKMSISLSADQPILALCPGAEYGPAKRWPAEHFAELARVQHKAGWAVWLLGSPKETDIAERIQQDCGHCCTNFVGKSNLPQAIDLLSLSTAVVANDSGLMHVACALDKPVAALYGSTPPEIAPPLSDKAHIFYNKTPCSPCFERQCPLGHFECLRGLSPLNIANWLKQVGANIT